jgi:ElaB/YqjD/DUF883 family membrane-anchored ribosome-binding protein
MSQPATFPGDGAAPYSAASDGLDPPAPTPATELLNRVVQGAHASLDRLAESATPQVQQLEAGLAAAGDTLQAGADQVRHTRDEWAESLRSTVRDHPLATVAAALAAGVLIARLTR